MRYLRFASTALLILGQTPGWCTQTLCDEIRTWPAPRPFFIRPERQLLKIENQKPVPVATKEQHRPPHGSFYFAAEAGNRLRLSTGTGKDLIFSVPEFDYRPLEARWINPKLLYVDVSFDPHNGAYWIYDVEAQKVVVNELENDGQDAWSQCHSKQNQNLTREGKQ